MISILPHLDVGRALLAVIISATFYVVIEREKNPLDTGLVDVPVEITNVPTGLLVIGDDPTRSVQARLSAPREMWPSLRTNTLRALVDLSRASAGGDLFHQVAMDSPDPRVRVLELIPPQISVRLDQTIDRTVPVRLNRTGSVPFGYDTGTIVVEPTTVSVSGPASVVRRVDVATVEIRLDGTTVDIDGRYRPMPVDAQGIPLGTEGAPIRVSPGNIRVQIPVAQQLSYKTVGIQPTVVGIPQPGHIIEGVTVEPPAITIVGSPQALAAVNFATTERVDTTDATSTFARQVSVLVPEGVSLVQEGVSRVTVRLNALDLAQSVFAIPLAENLDPGLMITSALPTVQIVIRGAPLALQALQGSDVRVTLPLGGLGDGSHQVELAAAAPLGISVQSMSPRVVAVTLATSATSSPSSPVPAPSPGLPGTPGATPAGATPEGGSP